jgi:putative Mg2+ transporter-C (MgtC) family protein
MTGEVLGEMLFRLAVSLGLGGVLGLERSYHGRPAGFRTHALVSLISGGLMLVTVYESLWFPAAQNGVHGALDPTRMAQGIMTGIGFLGAGVIMKEGLSIRGLTTAASIWVTSGIGILVGIGLYLPAGMTTVLALGALSGFRWIEGRMRTESYSQLTIEMAAASAPEQAEIVALVRSFGFSVRDVTHHFSRGNAVMAYRLNLHTLDRTSVPRISAALRAREDVTSFGISPSGD